jgi:hypothetical protein
MRTDETVADFRFRWKTRSMEASMLAVLKIKSRAKDYCDGRRSRPVRSTKTSSRGLVHVLFLVAAGILGGPNFGEIGDLRPRSDLTKVICPEQSVARASVSPAMRTDETVADFRFR